MIEQMKINGKVSIYKNGDFLGKYNNLVVTTGKEWVANRIRGAGATPITHIGIGTGTVAATSSDTTLGSQYSTRASATVSVGTTNSIVLLASTHLITSTVSITEAGSFTASTSGTMVSRVKFPAIDCVNGDSIVIQWELEVG